MVTTAISYRFEPRSRHRCLSEASLVHGERLKFVTPYKARVIYIALKTRCRSWWNAGWVVTLQPKRVADDVKRDEYNGGSLTTN